MLRKVFILVLILVLSSLAISAQELPEDANACNEGGAMEGKCNIDFDGDGVVNDYEVTWAWTCGWYMIRYDAGIFAEVPLFCQSLLPSEPIDEVVSEEETDNLCFYQIGPGEYRIYEYIGPGEYKLVVDLSPTPQGHPECGPDLPL